MGPRACQPRTSPTQLGDQTCLRTRARNARSLQRDFVCTVIGPLHVGRPPEWPPPRIVTLHPSAMPHRWARQSSSQLPLLLSAREQLQRVPNKVMRRDTTRRTATPDWPPGAGPRNPRFRPFAFHVGSAGPLAGPAPWRSRVEFLPLVGLRRRRTSPIRPGYQRSLTDSCSKRSLPPARFHPGAGRSHVGQPGAAVRRVVACDLRITTLVEAAEASEPQCRRRKVRSPVDPRAAPPCAYGPVRGAREA